MSASTDPAREQPRGEQEDVEHDSAATEQTPLLPPGDSNTAEPNDQSQPQHEQSAQRSLLTSLQGAQKGGKRRWPSILALLLLCLLVILIIVFAFLAPSTVEQYAQQAVVFEPTSLSIDSLTATGVRARIQGDFSMDASRVHKKPVRDLGKFFTYIAREAESGESEVEVSLPEYGNVVLGTATVPGIKVDLRNGHTTHVDFLSDLAPGDVDGIRRIANDWIEGRLGQVRVLGKATVPVKSGLFSLGKQNIQQEMLFANKDIPTMPSYDIKKLNFREVELPKGGKGMATDVALVVQNDYPVDFTVPPLAFDILVDNCHKSDPYIKLADAETLELQIRPKEEVELNVTGLVHQLPDLLTQDCPGSNRSPLDIILGNYIHGKENTIYVQGSDSPQLHTPQWVTDLVAGITVPVGLPGRTFGHLIKRFSLNDTHISLPDPFASPDSPKSNPRISAKVHALVALPEDMNFNISVGRVRADADVFYKSKQLGKLDLNRWQRANSTQVAATKDDGPTLLVESRVRDAPLRITDEDVFTRVIEDMVFGGKPVMLHIKADVDVEISTLLGELAVRKIPAEGQIPIKPISRGGGRNGPSFRPKVHDLRILETGPTSLTLSALVNMTNPTDYAATVPFIDIHIMENGTLLGHATARDVHVVPGENYNLFVTAVYDPLTSGGEEAAKVGRELLSQYISGYNTTITLQLHNGSLPTQPALGKALSKFAVEIPTPSLRVPAPPNNPLKPPPGDGGDGDDKPHFIKDATMHLFTSTATFELLSPLRHEILYVTSIDATAYYKGDDVGHIVYDLPFAVPPVDAEGKGVISPRLPVDWSLDSVGYEAVKRALGGRLKLSAEAKVGVRLGQWREEVWFKGRGIGASVRL